MVHLGQKLNPPCTASVTLRASTEQGLPQNQIQDDAETVSNHNRNDRPQNPVHTPARSVAVDVDDQQEIAAEYGSGEKAEQLRTAGDGVSF